MTTPATTLEAPPFRVIAKGIVLRHLRRTNPLAGCLRGDVAEIDGRRIARYTVKGRDGTPLVGTVELAPDEDLDRVLVAARN